MYSLGICLPLSLESCSGPETLEEARRPRLLPPSAPRVRRVREAGAKGPFGSLAPLQSSFVRGVRLLFSKVKTVVEAQAEQHVVSGSARTIETSFF